MSTTTKIDAISHLRISTGTGQALTTDKMIVLCNGRVNYGWFGSWSGTNTIYANTATEFSVTAASQNWYFTDGTNLKKVVGSSGAVSTVTTGSTGQPPANARLVTLYRNRLVLSRIAADPHNWFMSAVGVYDNFDYTNQDAGVQVAVAGNNAPAGKVGDVITCLAPFNDQYLLMGCADSVWMMRGDPAEGGRIDNLVWGGGIVGPDAWARDSEGRMYYVSKTDLMMLAPGGMPQSVSGGRIQKFFSETDFSAMKVRLVWDVANVGLWIFFTPATAGATTHLFWDQRADAFTKMQFPNIFGPTAVCNLAGEVLQDRQILLGGFDSRLRTIDPGWTSDDGTAITSRVKFPPTILGAPGERGIISETELVIGNLPLSNMNTKWYVGDNPQAAITTTTEAISNTTQTTGRYLTRARARGQSAVFEISNALNGYPWAFESGHLMAMPAGRTK